MNRDLPLPNRVLNDNCYNYFEAMEKCREKKKQKMCPDKKKNEVLLPVCFEVLQHLLSMIKENSQ